MSHVHDIVSAGEASTLLETEIKWLSDEEKQHIWLKASGISIASEEKMWQISREMIRGNLKGKIAPFSFSLKSGGEEIRGAALVYVPNLVEKVFQLLDENAKAGRLTWHEVWIKLGGDKGGGTFKMSFQIVNVPPPNCPQHTCVFCCFEADDSITNLHVALDRFQDQVEELQRIKLEVCLPGLHIILGVFTKIFKLLEDTCHKLDLKLACSSSQIAASSSTFEEYHQEMLRMLSAKEDLTSQIKGLNGHEQLTT
ncbi:hypothetical protein EMCRGX_G002639 [Ephydatia muelleri]